MAKKQDKCIHIIDTYVNGTSGYRIWSDGYCEQWGYIKNNNTINLLKEFADTNYFAFNCPQANATGSFAAKAFFIETKTTSTLKFGSTNDYIYWKASGYLAEGEY